MGLGLVAPLGEGGVQGGVEPPGKQVPENVQENNPLDVSPVWRAALAGGAGAAQEPPGLGGGHLLVTGLAGGQIRHRALQILIIKYYLYLNIHSFIMHFRQNLFKRRKTHPAHTSLET